ncbi:uncharacterized protein LOC123272840 [Cotesia glomerata]|uniref:SAM domain-containing protein n=1 Tax=Cotesia glomerata TaxID=32391 RepID=A0AAV7J4B0_COTGL|nr:uncharacterized protein LOC123272840 [Cotesia glomerata]KAH0564274.1 hypothetical protein KQX54_011118 [Cotesia glomerata]
MNLPSDDVFGFTQQTAMILEGFEATDLIPEFKKRNISTSVLSELSKEDFMTLGASEELADKIIKQLGSKLRKPKSPFNSLIDNSSIREEKLTDIIKNTHQQLAFFQVFINFNRVKLSKLTDDYVIDLNKNVRASEALHLVTKCAIQQLNDLQSDIRKLVTIIEADETKNQSQKRKLIGAGLFIGLIGSSILIINFLKKSH